MNRLRVGLPLFRCALGIVFLTFFARAGAGSVIYEYREAGTMTVIGTLEIAEPPAIADSGWSTSDPSDIVALFLVDGVSGQEPGNLPLAGATVDITISSFDGSKLDGGGMSITFATFFPSNPADPTIDRSLSCDFGEPAGADIVRLATFLKFPDGRVLIGDTFLEGDWTAAPTTPAVIAEPTTLALLSTGLLAARRSTRRRRW